MIPRKMDITICGRTVILFISLWLIGLACPLTPVWTADTTDSRPKISKSGIPYRPDNAQAGPEDLVNAIRSRRPGGKLLNLDRMLLHSPAFARGWNTMFAAIRGQLALSLKLRELAIMAVGVINKADYE